MALRSAAHISRLSCLATDSVFRTATYWRRAFSFSQLRYSRGMASKRGMPVRVEYSESVYRRIRNEDRQLLRVEASFADPPVSHWGFVIYRTAYGKGTDSLFQRLITKIEADAITLTQRMGRSDLGNKLRWEVIDDQQCFDSVATEVVRENFIQLCLDRGVPLTEARPG
ncbi:hypothetical protein JX265_011024 [Neoarthrinium moseri]|uniref:Uncharacterized protein n=1 Tax=Neoarthrinium moseri TaxID=1658444 RepID=A0A9P9WDB0_9PEZI|nr:hypothetical protein JX265_011024 [Neoarthrinium moseri]